MSLKSLGSRIFMYFRRNITFSTLTDYSFWVNSLRKASYKKPKIKSTNLNPNLMKTLQPMQLSTDKKLLIPKFQQPNTR